MLRLAAAASALLTVVAHARPADACGGFIAHNEGLRINDALELVVVRDGTHTELSVRNRYRGPVEAFAILVPVPVVLQKEDVHTLDDSVFDSLAALTSPQVYYLSEDDPCRPPPSGDDKSVGAPRGGRGADAVSVEAAFQVGEYDVEVLSATDATALGGWLKAHGYQIPDAMAALLRPYVDSGSKFFVAKVDPARVQFVGDVATLSPLRFGYDADEVSLPLRLSTANSPGVQDVLVHAIARTRLDAANRPAATIPTGLEMAPGVEFAQFYEALFAATLAPKPDAVVTEYARTANSYHGPVLAALGATGEPSKWVVTRLHLRPTKAGTQDDLVLRAAEPIQGGRHAYDTVENAFAAEYQVHQPWTGPVKCGRPRWGNWEPDGSLGGAVRFGAPVPEAKLELASLVGADVPALGVVAKYRPPARPEARRGDGGGCGCATGGDAGSSFALVVMVMLGLRGARPAARDRRARRV